MDNAVWVILYAVAHAHRERYLAWFHDVHVADKLARPGYTWASHYALPGDGRDHYIALFGGNSTRTFLDPSPAQLRQGQDAQTREMMDCRLDSRAYVVTCEWRDGPGADSAVQPPWLRLARHDAGGHDQDLGAWLVQQRLPARSRQPGFVAMYKWLATFGPQRHLLAEAFTDREAAERPAAAEDCDWARRVASQVQEPDGPALVAGRIWPAA